MKHIISTELSEIQEVLTIIDKVMTNHITVLRACKVALEFAEEGRLSNADYDKMFKAIDKALNSHKRLVERGKEYERSS